MAVREVLTYPDPVLKQVCSPAQPEEIERVVTDLLDTMASFDHCVGLAAPQIGEAVRIAVVDVSSHPKAKDPQGLMVLVNPHVVGRSEGSKVSREGCLSLPDLTANVRRPRKATVEFTGIIDPEGLNPKPDDPNPKPEQTPEVTVKTHPPGGESLTPQGKEGSAPGGGEESLSPRSPGGKSLSPGGRGGKSLSPGRYPEVGEYSVHRIELSSFEARCVLHEIDHLDGILFLDRVTSITDDLFRRQTYR